MVGGARAKGLGAELRRLRDSLELTNVQVSERIGISPSTISRIETGVRTCSNDEAVALLTVYGVKGTEKDRLVALARDTPQLGWLGLGQELEHQLSALISYENEAVGISAMALQYPPGLLQTPEFIRAMLAREDSNNIEFLIRARISRQDTLSRPDFERYNVLLDEGALRRRIGGEKVMMRQLMHLIYQSRHNHIDIRVVPTSTGHYPGLSGDFTIFHRPNYSDVVYYEVGSTGSFIEDENTVDEFAERFEDSVEKALDAEESLALIEDYMKGRT